MQDQLLLDAICQAAEESSTAEPFVDALSILPRFLETHRIEEMAYARYLRELASDKVADADDPASFVDVVKEILKLNAPEDLDSYMLYTEWDRKPGKRFWRPRRDVLMPVCMGFQDLEDDLIDILVVSLPPRVGKSTTGIFATTWHMGRHPGEANLMSGHSDKLTTGFHQEALSLVKGAEYKFHEIFPDSVVLKYSLQEETIQLKSIRRFPSLTCRAIGGTLTGAVEVGKGGWLYCDDLVSDREEAMSEERMEKLYEAYMNQLVDRKLDGAKEVHVSTRWCPNDPIGVLLETKRSDSRIRVVVIPALNAEGGSNFQYSEGHGFSTEYYLDQKQRLVSAGQEDAWEAKFMGHPFYVGGLMFPQEELRFYSQLPEGEPDAIYAVCDTKDRGTDYAVQIVGYQYGDDHYIESVICDNSLPQVVEPRLVAQLVSHGVSVARYESNGAGGRIADDVAKACSERGLVLKMEKRYSTENKETRILVDSGWVTQRCLFKESDNADYSRFLDMLTHYTTAGKNRNDDAPDAMSMYKRLVTSMAKSRIEAFARPF